MALKPETEQTTLQRRFFMFVSVALQGGPFISGFGL
jgi:hypothetical protein